MFNSDVYKKRRENLIKALFTYGEKSGLVLFPGNNESPKNYADNCYKFRQDSTFLYFFGLQEAGMAAALDIETGKATLFVDDISIDSLVWSGPRPFAKDYQALCAAEFVKPRIEFDNSIRSAKKVLFLPPYRADSAIELSDCLNVKPSELNSMASISLIRSIVGMREIKEDIEIASIEQAVDISIEMHKAVIAAANDGKTEQEMMSEAYHVAYKYACPSFPAIATTRGSVLHNHGYEGTLHKGGLFLLDSGAESVEGYAGDLTSTFPIGKKFDEKQKAIYEIVFAAGKAASSKIKAGINYRECHFAAAETIASGLKDLGIIKGDISSAVEKGAVSCFFPHGVGHQMGLDVHDMENYGENYVGYDTGKETFERSKLFGLKSLRMAKPLKTGMVLTVEPGIYFIPGLISAWKAEGRYSEYINFDEAEKWLPVGGIRNEEDWLVLDNGARVLGSGFDKSIAAIEALCEKHL